MNIYVVRRATQGLANHIIKQGGADKGVAIAYDSRHMSPEFAEEAALTLAANGIKAYKFESLRPTPEPVSTSPQATTRLSITDTKFTGRTAHSLPRLTTRE